MAKNTNAQEVSTGTSASFTDAEYRDPEPHLAMLRNRPGLRDSNEIEAPVLESQAEQEQASEELDEFESGTETVPEEEFEEPDVNPDADQPAESSNPDGLSDLEARQTPGEDTENEPDFADVKPAPRKAAKKAPAKKAQPAKPADDEDVF